VAEQTCGAGATDFDVFWARYPRKVGKLDALKAYTKARSIATAEEILSGVEQFLQHLPEEMQFVPHAATWLNKGRWMDSYEPLPVKATTPAYRPYVPFRVRDAK